MLHSFQSLRRTHAIVLGSLLCFGDLVSADDCGGGVWFRSQNFGKSVGSGPDGYGVCLGNMSWKSQGQKYGVKCDGHSCTASDGAMIEIVGMGGPDGCTISVPEDIPKDVADVWGGDCTRSQSGINHVTCDGGEWHVMQTWSWFLEGNSGRYLCHGRKLLPLSQCEAPFKVTKYDPTPDAGKSVEPIGGLGAQLQMCLPAGQEWDPNTTVKVAASSSLTWSKADEVDIGGGLEFSSGANILMPEAKWTAHFDAKHTYTQGGTTTSTEEQTVGNQFKMPVLKEYDQFINIRAQQFLYKVDVVLTGKSGCCEDPKYDHTGCDKDKDVKVEVSLTTSSSDFTDTNLLCIQKDPWAAKYPGQGASSSYCQGDTESGNFPGRSKYVGCYHGGVEKETLERCQKECDTKTWIPPFIKKTSCWGRVADNYNHQRSGKKSLQEAITEMEGVCGECRNEQQ